MKSLSRVFAISAVVASMLTACGSPGEGEGSEASGAGFEACSIYQRALAGDSAAVTSVDAMPDIKAMLDEIDDDLTRRAFAALITADEANPFSPTTDPNAVYEAAAEVRTVCLSEHAIAIPAP